VTDAIARGERLDDGALGLRHDIDAMGLSGRYRRGEIDGATVRHLTLASREKQRQWLALWRDPSARAPTGGNVKHWLFGGQSIPTTAAIFPLDSYQGQIVADLFGEDSYFADAEAFWAAQMAAMGELRDRYLADGWHRVEVLETGTYFQRWQHEKISKSKGGAVYIAVSARGEVEAHEGWLTRKEAGRASGDTSSAEKPARPELSAPLRNYLNLHRHAAVRATLLDHPAAAFRLMVAHAICGSALWSVRVDPQRAHSTAILESVETCASETAFDLKRREVLGLIEADPEALAVTKSMSAGLLTAVFRRLLALSDAEVLAVAAIVMGETLEADGPIIDDLGSHLSVDMASIWTADEAFFDLVRDRRVASAIVAELAGVPAAEANAEAKLKVQKGIIRDCLSGENGRAKVEGWVPRWLKFPEASYLLAT
jgi:ParB family chromosome partitioning protein